MDCVLILDGITVGDAKYISVFIFVGVSNSVTDIDSIVFFDIDEIAIGIVQVYVSFDK